MGPLTRSFVALSLGILLPLAANSTLHAGDPMDLLRGEAPLLFTGGEGEDATDTLLADGVNSIRGDEIWLWVPAIDSVSGMVDLIAPGQFFRIWDSGPELGPDGNDDDRNGMRGMDFDPISGTFLISYEDSTTTGFTFGDILDGDLMELTVTAVTNGAISGFQWARLFSECTNGSPGCIGTGDLNALHRPDDGTFYVGSGAAQTINVDLGGTIAAGSSTLLHLVAAPDPVHLGPTAFFEPTVAGCPLPFCPGIYTGQLRGVDLLVTGEVTFGTSGDYRNQAPSGNDVVVVGEKADICALPDLFSGATLLEQRTAEVLYPGSLFFDTPNIGDAEILDHDILDSSTEIQALIDLLGAGSPPALALAPFVSSGCPWLRGDATGNGSLGLNDAVYILVFLFNGGPTPIPEEAVADNNADGNVGLNDAILLLVHLFANGPAPVPGPGC